MKPQKRASRVAPRVTLMYTSILISVVAGAGVLYFCLAFQYLRVIWPLIYFLGAAGLLCFTMCGVLGVLAGCSRNELLRRVLLLFELLFILWCVGLVGVGVVLEVSLR